MIKFSKEEISLCKQVGKRYRKPIGYGDWFLDPNVMEEYQARLCTYMGERKFGEAYRNFTPLWTISDCLEFLEEKGFTYIFNFINREGSYEYGEQRREYELSLYNNHTHETQLIIGKTCKIVALKAVLAVLEEGK